MNDTDNRSYTLFDHFKYGTILVLFCLAVAACTGTVRHAIHAEPETCAVQARQ